MADPKIFATQYADLASLPLVSGASYQTTLGDGSRTVNVVLSQRDIHANKWRKFQQTYVVSEKNSQSVSAFPVEIAGQASSIKSPSGRLFATVTKEGIGGKKDAKSQACIKVYENGKFRSSHMLGDVHGDIHSSGILGGFSWSSDETKIVYVAERKVSQRFDTQKEPKTYFDELLKPKKKEEEKDGDKKDDDKDESFDGRSYEYVDDLGEEMVNALMPRLFVLDLASNEVSEVAAVPLSVVPGQVQWAPDGETIVYVGWAAEPRNLGLRHYNSRKSAIYSCNPASDDTPITLTPEDHSPMYVIVPFRCVFDFISVSLCCSHMLTYYFFDLQLRFAAAHVSHPMVCTCYTSRRMMCGTTLPVLASGC